MKIFVNGNFKTLNGDDVEALVCDEKIYYAGTTKEALRFDGNVIDLKGKTILPGFLDLTTEFLTTVYSKAFLDISKVSTVREIIFLIENRINNKELIIAHGYDQNKLDRELSSLDIEFENPVLLIHRNRDKGIVNSSFRKEYNVYFDYYEGDDFINLVKNVKDFSDAIFETIPYAVNLYYEKGFVTQTARVEIENNEELINQMNYDNIVILETNKLCGKSNRKILRIDTDTHNRILFEEYELLSLLNEYADENKQVFLLCHSINAINLVKNVIKDIDVSNKRWNLISTVYLEQDDLRFFTVKGLTFSVDLDYEMIARRDLKYEPFSYLKFLERNDIYYSFYTDKKMESYNVLERMNLFVKTTRLPKEEINLRLLKMIKGVTIDKAYSLGLENRLGLIKEGYDANFIVLNNDPFESLDDIKIEKVYKNGRLVYELE